MWVNPMAIEPECPAGLRRSSSASVAAQRKQWETCSLGERGELTTRGPFKYELGP